LHEQIVLSASFSQFVASLEQSCQLLNAKGLEAKSEYFNAIN